jgi:metallo-beta-lactamase family protein
MAEGGRILHHLKNNIQDPRNLILFVGYAAKETLARKIMDGNQVVKIFGEEHVVKAKIRVMDAFSAHADRRNLLDYVDLNSPAKLRHIFLIHGETDQALPLRDGLRSKGYGEVHYPELNSIFAIDKNGEGFVH